MSLINEYEVGDLVQLIKNTKTPNNKFNKGDKFTVVNVISSKVDLVDIEGRKLTIPFVVSDQIKKCE